MKALFVFLSVLLLFGCTSQRIEKNYLVRFVLSDRTVAELRSGKVVRLIVIESPLVSLSGDVYLCRESDQGTLVLPPLATSFLQLESIQSRSGVVFCNYQGRGPVQWIATGAKVSGPERRRRRTSFVSFAPASVRVTLREETVSKIRDEGRVRLEVKTSTSAPQEVGVYLARESNSGTLEMPPDSGFRLRLESIKSVSGEIVNDGVVKKEITMTPGHGEGIRPAVNRFFVFERAK